MIKQFLFTIELMCLIQEATFEIPGWCSDLFLSNIRTDILLYYHESFHIFSIILISELLYI